MIFFIYMNIFYGKEISSNLNNLVLFVSFIYFFFLRIMLGKVNNRGGHCLFFHAVHYENCMIDWIEIPILSSTEVLRQHQPVLS